VPPFCTALPIGPDNRTRGSPGREKAFISNRTSLSGQHGHDEGLFALFGVTWQRPVRKAP
jgi:hypothetical protein